MGINTVALQYRRATAMCPQQTIGDLEIVVAPQVYCAVPYSLGHWYLLDAFIFDESHRVTNCVSSIGKQDQDSYYLRIALR